MCTPTQSFEMLYPQYLGLLSRPIVAFLISWARFFPRPLGCIEYFAILRQEKEDGFLFIVIFNDENEAKKMLRCAPDLETI